MPVLVDTGPLVAFVNARDANHARVRQYLENTEETLVVPVSVLPEVCYLLARYMGPRIEAEFISALQRGEMLLEQITQADLARSAELILAYADNPIGFVDASLVAVAERLNIARILTLDRRHFTSIRPRHVPAFELLP